MPNCEICDQELFEGDFEEKIGICTNCIMIESRKKSSKLFIFAFIIFGGVLMFIAAFLLVILSVTFPFVGFEQRLFYLIPSLIWCVISGSGVIYFSIVYKFR